MSINVLVTGATGYIGSVLCPYLVDKGIRVKSLDTGFFIDSTLYTPEHDLILQKDVRDIVDSDLDGIDVVVHLAGISNDPMGKLEASTVYDPTRVYTSRLAKMCKNKSIRFIFASSCSVYGKGSDDVLSEASPTSPQTYYSLNKLQIEQDLAQLSDQTFSPIALRFATVFGSSPRMRFDIVINMFVGMALTEGNIVLNSDGKAWRPNIHILDVCKSIYLAINSGYSDPELLVLNVGDASNNIRIIDLAKKVSSMVSSASVLFLSQDPDLDKEGLITDRKINTNSRDTRSYQVSFNKIKSVFPDFQCDFSIESGVSELLSRLSLIKFDTKIFKSRDFYRLQKLESLYNINVISDDLRWVPN
ncbi:SDR family oxidoreductase [Synechococcus sp. HB1133]|uniref:NAD-dependent epimerase/dehydratase family protein n=1 Tax=unclassified Synechococcus TaxID=2626047 RepID=UPI00140DE90B|nr:MULTISPECIES: SDR family oxidoreductase [unclassified Synechococcus]MCB4421473.1 SDR family oxidoreductase [Synechococcus sp. HB1133]MCB4431176.1 SDR family oxidoreductase [Synechococcus sp. HBA1120]NHI80415.1 SDR family oxidoreductase [Synechococcus sp. HB1133]